MDASPNLRRLTSSWETHKPIFNSKIQNWHREEVDAGRLILLHHLKAGINPAFN